VFESRQALEERAIVIGGGIGGLAAAVALRRAGIDVAVFEQQHDLRKTQVGGGIHMWANAMRALAQLGLAERVTELGAPIERTEFRDWRGRLLAVWPIGEIAREFGTRDAGISRGELQQVLVDAQENGNVNAGVECTGFEQDASGVTARFADGREERGSLLVGADGLRSTIRAQLLGSAPPRYAGYAQFQSLVAAGADLLPAGVERVVFGRGNRAVLHRVGGNRLFWAGALYAPEGTLLGQAKKETLLKRFRGWEPPIETAIEATPEDLIVAFDIYDRPPVDRWGEGRVTLVGDAAHPMTTNLSQGGCQALEDAVVLASSLKADSDVARALRAYEERRIPRTSTLVKRSHGIARMGGIKNPVAAAVRDRISGIALGRAGVKDYRKFVATQEL
jgi:2-polyprenyl-6-methoxyphenol hydroxylase-like FAD-dependent oxidoreductase